MKLVCISALTVSTFKILQFLCQIGTDSLCPCFDSFLAVAPCVVGLCEVLHEIFYSVGVIQAELHGFYLMRGVLDDSGKWLIDEHINIIS